MYKPNNWWKHIHTVLLMYIHACMYIICRYIHYIHTYVCVYKHTVCTYITIGKIHWWSSPAPCIVPSQPRHVAEQYCSKHMGFSVVHNYSYHTNLMQHYLHMSFSASSNLKHLQLRCHCLLAKNIIHAMDSSMKIVFFITTSYTYFINDHVPCPHTL